MILNYWELLLRYVIFSDWLNLIFLKINFHCVYFNIWVETFNISLQTSAPSHEVYTVPIPDLKLSVSVKPLSIPFQKSLIFPVSKGTDLSTINEATNTYKFIVYKLTLDNLMWRDLLADAVKLIVAIDLSN